jgi:deoxycytidylate deaminase
MADGPELFIGLVGAVGTDLKRVAELLAQEFRRVDYTYSVLRLSDLLLDCHANSHIRQSVSGPEDTRIEALMRAGDELRRISARGDAVALLAMGKVRQIRQDRGAERRPLSRHAFLLHSLKHPAEIQTLREIYEGAFVAISVYTPRSSRLKVLCDRISRSRQDYRPENYEYVAERLINTDEKEVGDDLGQNVRDTFPEADVFLDATDPEQIPQQVTRLIELLFRHPYHTPTLDEYGLFHAKAAALRSADLSRQVGAVITTEDGEIIAAGCNEVPKAGGGSVWEGRDEDRTRDQRDFILGHDSSARMKHEILEEVFVRLREANWLRDNLISLDPSELVAKALFSPDVPVLAGTRAASIIEFGRIVHAEMSAITDAARRGLSVKGATLYCTTFPCHMCARHIIAAGIQRVVYIEPYPKSMAKELYKGSLDVDHDPEADADAVAFRPFVGVSPRRYIEFFEMPKRKDERGYVIEWTPVTATPRIKQYPTYLDVEAVHVDQLAEHRFDWGLTERTK